MTILSILQTIKCINCIQSSALIVSCKIIIQNIFYELNSETFVGKSKHNIITYKYLMKINVNISLNSQGLIKAFITQNQVTIDNLQTLEL